MSIKFKKVIQFSKITLLIATYTFIRDTLWNVSARIYKISLKKKIVHNEEYVCTVHYNSIHGAKWQQLVCNASLFMTVN